MSNKNTNFDGVSRLSINQNLKTSRYIWISLILIIVSFLLSTIVSIKTLNDTIKRDSETTATLVAENIYNDINSTLRSHVDVGLSIASNKDLIDIIKSEDTYSKEEMEEILKSRLSLYADQLGYNTVFVVCGNSGNYYTQSGFNKTVSPDTDDHDVWYSAFLERNEKYGFDIDIDQVNGDIWTVFLNVRIEDENGEFLGVCGVGTEMKNIQKMFHQIKEEYDTDVNIIDKDGLVMLDIDDATIEQTIYDAFSIDDNSEEYILQKHNKGYVITKYMKDLEWALIIQKKIDTTQLLIGLIARNLLVLLAVFATIFIISAFIVRKGSKALEENIAMYSYGVLAGIYEGMYIIDVSKDTVKEIKNIFKREFHLFNQIDPISVQMKGNIIQWVDKSQSQSMEEFMDFTTLSDRLAGKESIYREFIAENLGWCRARFIPIRNARPIGKKKSSETKIDKFILAIELIDEEKRLQESLRNESEAAKAASEAKGRFLANMSHEIRTPINAVLGMDTMILRESKEPKIKEYALNIQSAGNSLLSIINDILDITKIESGKMEIKPVVYDFSSLIFDVINMVQTKAESKNLEFKLNIDENLPSTLFGDDIRIKQVLTNILSNAVKYTKEGSVTLSISGYAIGKNEFLSFSVKDTGIGIKQEDIGKLFADFERIEEKRNRHIEGTGLGMSITRQLLEMMNSTLNVDSVYGEGSEFYFELKQEIRDNKPIGDFSKRLANKAENYNYSVSFAAPSATVLVVDDNATNRLVFTSLLKETKINIDEADNGMNALNMLQEKQYDIVFLDHMMPGMDGIQVLEELKKLPDCVNSQTPVIILTANAVSGAKEKYLAAGFNGYLSKPINPDKLEKMIFSLLPDNKKEKVEKVIVENDTKSENVNELVSELPMVEGIDWEYGMLHVKTVEQLMSIVKSFYYTIDSEVDYISEKYENIVSITEKKYDVNSEDYKEAMDLYRIKVHAIKSTANSFGATGLSGVALMLEIAARNNNVALIKEVTPHFIEKLIDYKLKLKFAAEDANGEEKKEVTDKTLITDYLNQLVFLVQNFDVHGADSVLEKILEFKYTGEINDAMNRLRGEVSNLNEVAVEEIANEIADLLK